MKSKDLYKIIFGEDHKKEVYKMVGHSFSKIVGGKQICSNCGLMALNNPFTVWCIDKGCYSDLHPNYRQVRKTLSQPLNRVNT